MNTTSQLSAYLTFNGNCEEAMNFYQSVLGGELHFDRFGAFAGDAMPIPEDQKDKIMHATLENDTLSFMASDARPDFPVTFGTNFSMSLSGTDTAQLTEFFNKLSDSGNVTMALEKQIWGDTFGMVVDKYGINWMVNIGAPTAAAQPAY